MTKTILITGATSGFGEACAHLFADLGWQLILLGRRLSRLETLQQDLEDKVPVHILPVDLQDRQALEKAFGQIPPSFQAIDVLVNNAGLALGRDPAQYAALDDWEIMVDTNIKGVLYITKLVLPGMVERDCGYIINIGSTAGNWPYAGGNVYGATKAFLHQLSRNLRSDLLGTHIRVTSIEPGMAETEFSVVRFKGDETKAKDVYAHTKPLMAEDIANTIAWLVNLPLHMNVNSLEIMPTYQAWGPTITHRIS